MSGGDVRVLLADLQTCSNTLNLEWGKEVHAKAIQGGYESSYYVASALIHMYAKCRSMRDARQVFDKMHQLDVVSWTALILGYADNGEGSVALYMFTRMRSCSCLPNSWTFVAALKACTSLALKHGSGKAECRDRGKGIHDLASEDGHNLNIYVQNTLIDTYSKSGSMTEARQVFDCMKHRNVVSWTALILGYVENGEGIMALHMFTRMRSQGCPPNSWTIVAALKACTCEALQIQDQISGGECRDRGRVVHHLASEDGCDTHIYVQSTLIDMYAKYGCMADARQVFDSIHQPDSASWTALIMGYANNEDGVSALDMFRRMRCPDSRTFAAVLKACTSLVKQGVNGRAECKVLGEEIHSLATESGYESDIYVQSALIDMYAKCESMIDARQVFDNMKSRDVVSWTALILGYADNGEGAVALDMFKRMKSEGESPNSWTFVAVLKASGLLGALEFGRELHTEFDTGTELNVILVTCLVDFYAKCGSLREAQKVFDLHPRARNVTTWNALLAGHGRLGDSQAVFELFERMKDAGFRPLGVTFLCILACYSHAGLVEKATESFEAMSSNYGITPTIEHYNCMVDVLGRSNKLENAIALLQKMPCSPNAVSWQTVLGACCKWNNVEIGRLAFQSLIRYDDRNAAAYIIMASIYGSRGMWQEQEMVIRERKKLKALKKTEQSCWTNEMGEVHTFLLEDRKHPQMHDIQEKLKAMQGYAADLMNVEALCGHSEKLALACALINTEPGKTIRIVKNLRSCDDCHSSIAVISKLERRNIICDANTFHVFMDGKCSCGDS